MATNSLDRDCEAFWAIQDAITGWSIVAVHPHMIYRAGLVFDLERGGEKKTVAIFQDGSNAPMTLEKSE